MLFTVSIHKAQGQTFVGDTTVCGGVLLTAPDASVYLWSTGDTSREINATSSGSYWVLFDGVSSDTIQVTVLPPEITTLGNQTKIKNSIDRPQQNFGLSVVAQDDWVFYGASSDRYVADGSSYRFIGSVFVYKRENGGIREVQRLRPSNLRDSFRIFGPERAIDVKDSLLLVGAPGFAALGGDVAGEIYVYKLRDNYWQQKQTLASVDPAIDDGFGYNSCIGERFVFIGSLIYDEITTQYRLEVESSEIVGDTLIFVEKIIIPSDDITTSKERSPTSVDSEGSWLAISNPGHDASGLSDVGIVFLYQLDGSTWVLKQTINYPASIEQDAFLGWDLSMIDSTMVVGSPGSNLFGIDYGTVFLYKLLDTGVWEYDTALSSSDPESGAEFGDAVSMQGDAIAVGAYKKDGTGAACVYEHTAMGWSNSRKIVAMDAMARDRFGYDVYVDNHTLYTGSRDIMDNGIAIGSGYIYQLCDFYVPDQIRAIQTSTSINSQWQPIEPYARCRVSGGESLDPQKGRGLFNQSDPPALAVPLSKLDSSTHYTWQVQCACSLDPLVLSKPSMIDTFLVASTMRQGTVSQSGYRLYVSSLEGRLIAQKELSDSWDLSAVRKLVASFETNLAPLVITVTNQDGIVVSSWLQSR